MLPNYVTSVCIHGQTFNAILLSRLGPLAVYIEYDQLQSWDKQELNEFLVDLAEPLPLLNPEVLYNRRTASGKTFQQRFKPFVQTTFDFESA